MRYNVSLLTEFDLHLFNEGTHFRVCEKLGAHQIMANGHWGRILGFGRRMLKKYLSLATLTGGINPVTLCILGIIQGFGKDLFPELATALSISIILYPAIMATVWKKLIPSLSVMKFHPKQPRLCGISATPGETGHG